jgi:hypothetical protein
MKNILVLVFFILSVNVFAQVDIGDNGGLGNDYVDYDTFLNQHTDREIFQMAKKEKLGECRIVKYFRNYDDQCLYWVQARGFYYPNDQFPICTLKRYTKHYGCSHMTQKKNAVCLIKQAIREGWCF